MARTFGKVFVTMWNDPDFLADLGPFSKYLYNFLIGQPDLAHSGVITMRTTPWARRMGITVEQVEAALDELHAKRYVVMDRDEMLVLVRSLMRRDKVYAQPNVFKSAAEQIYTVPSKPILAALAAELERIGDEDMTAESRRVCSVLGRWLHSVTSSGNPDANGHPGTFSGVVGEDTNSGHLFDVFAGDEGYDNPDGNPVSRAYSPTPSTSPSTTPFPVAPEPSAPKGEAPGFDEFWSVYPRHESKPRAEKAWKAALKRGADPRAVIDGARSHAEGHAVRGTEPNFIPHPATWLNNDKWNDPPPKPLTGAGIPHQAYRQSDQPKYGRPTRRATP